ncbi:hypothetical protein T02_9504 [Trichinella nativa]|uniref:Uncharacterized protein n=1 Tax=Trichinella nativa TaxID=6335 RepID=A0A0V1KK10_9BILA|nr:hypothetical protein T02_9504 [Trichinella nativa]
MPSNHVRRERKETIEQFKILYLPITHGFRKSCVTAGILTEAWNVVTFPSEGSPSDPGALLTAGTLSFVSEVLRATLLLLVVKMAS